VALPAAGRRTSLLLARLLLTAGGAIIDRYIGASLLLLLCARVGTGRRTDSFVIDTFFVIRRDYMLPRVKVKGKVFPYSLPSVGPGADPGVQAVSPQVT